METLDKYNMQIMRLENMLFILKDPKEIEWTKGEINKLERLIESKQVLSNKSDSIWK